MALTDLYCAHMGCHGLVEHVCIQKDQERMLFRSAAGLICEGHRTYYEEAGGVTMTIDAFLFAVEA